MEIDKAGPPMVSRLDFPPWWKPSVSVVFSGVVCSLFLYSQLVRSLWEIHSLCRKWEDKSCLQLRHQQPHTEISSWPDERSQCLTLISFIFPCGGWEYQVSCNVVETTGDTEHSSDYYWLARILLRIMILTQLVDSDSHFILKLKCKLQNISKILLN